MREPLRDSERLKHILEAIHNIENASKKITEEELSSNLVLRHALTWNIMIIGETANKLSKEFCTLHNQTNWRGITGMRNVLVHDYYQINVDELYSVITFDIPELKQQIETYIAELNA